MGGDPIEKREWVTLENGGNKIFGVMHRPLSGPARKPAVLICHGFGGNKCGKHRMYVNLSTALAKAGIASLRFDFRGSGDSEGEFYHMTLDGEVSDALKALDYLTDNSEIDSSRIGILGRSLGGAIAVMTAKRYARAKSMALWAPVFSGKQWQEIWAKRQTEIVQPLEEEYIHFNGEPTNITFVKQFFGMRLDQELPALHGMPLIHFHGEKDNMVTPEHAKAYRQYREGAVAPSRFVSLPRSDHDFSDPEEQLRMITETSQWFVETL